MKCRKVSRAPIGCGASGAQCVKAKVRLQDVICLTVVSVGAVACSMPAHREAGHASLVREHCEGIPPADAYFPTAIFAPAPEDDERIRADLAERWSESLPKTTEYLGGSTEVFEGRRLGTYTVFSRQGRGVNQPLRDLGRRPADLAGLQPELDV